MKVLLGGSLSIVEVPKDAFALIESWIEEDHEFLLGDAKGVDLALQLRLADAGVRNVTIYFAGDSARNNAGSWPTVRIDSGLNSRSHRMHEAKDRAMSELADFGLMIWDGKSIGTLTNAVDLVQRGKFCYIRVPTKTQELMQIKSSAELIDFREDYEEAFLGAEKRLKAFRRRAKKSSNDSGTLF